MRLFYNIIFYLVLPLILARLLWGARREPAYLERLGERFGFCPTLAQPGLVWIHAVSAGETNASAPLIDRLLDRGLSVIVTTMTPTGRQRIRRLFGDRVSHCYVPYDTPDAVARFLKRVSPATLVIIDTEMWPNMLRQAKRNGMRTLLVNARLSERSARRYRLIPGLVQSMLNDLDIVATQSVAHGKRFVSLGLSEDKLVVAGS
ncbi:MAG: glycosyltransferase N-terminal domain-containing protein, partial [Pseudohongiellaceae bacterium]